MCQKCDDYADAKASNREDKPCEVGDHDYGEAGEWPADLAADTEIWCQNCGWSLADVRVHEQDEIDESLPKNDA